MKLVCFPFAGGASYAYAPLARALPRGIEVVAHDLPNHGVRGGESPLHDMTALVDDFFDTTGRRVTGPFAFFGHSMGALLAWEIARRMSVARQRLPLHLFLSGREDPFAPGRLKNCWTLPTREFRDFVTSLGGSPPEVLANEELMAIFEPLLRADFEVVGGYAPARTGPVDTPMTVIYGQEELTLENVSGWRDLTRAEVRFVSFPGGHFSLTSRWPEVAQLVATTLFP